MKKILYIFIINTLLSVKSYALIEIDITRGNLDPLPIAVSPLHVDIKSEEFENIKVRELGNKISQIIENNFEAKKMIITFSDQFLAEYKLILL